MTRPTRNLALFGAFIVAAFVTAPLLPDVAVWSLAGVGLGVLVVSLVAGRRFFAGRAAMRGARWDEAARAFEDFRAEQTGGGWRRAVSFLFAGIYTPDGVALALNNLGAVRLNQRRLGEARALFGEALARDPSYAIPHVNLAIISALEGDAAAADVEAQRARELGFRRRGLQAAVRQALAAGNTAIGQAQSGGQ